MDARDDRLAGLVQPQAAQGGWACKARSRVKLTRGPRWVGGWVGGRARLILLIILTGHGARDVGGRAGGRGGPLNTWSSRTPMARYLFWPWVERSLSLQCAWPASEQLQPASNCKHCPQNSTGGFLPNLPCPPPTRRLPPPAASTSFLHSPSPTFTHPAPSRPAG